MRKTLSKIRNKILFIKQYIGRATGYLSLINSGMLLFLFLNKLKESGLISFNTEKYYVPIVILGSLILITFGWVDFTFLRGIQEEAKIGFELNPYYVEMRNNIREIKKEILKDE